MASTTLNGDIDDVAIKTTLNGDIDDSTTIFDVVDASEFSAPEFAILIDSEIMLVTDVTSNTFTVTRGYAGTTATVHYDTTIVEILTTINVNDAGGFTEPKFRIKVESEIMLVVGVINNEFTVVRGNVGSIATTHSDGTTVDYVFSTDIGAGCINM